MAGRPPRTANPIFAAEFAESLAQGLTNAQLMAEHNIGDVDTVRNYKKDPRVTSILTKLINQRVQEITRRVDSEVAKRLESPGEMTTDELLRVRKEYLGGALRQEAEKTDEGAVNAAMAAVEDPNFQALVAALGE